MAQIIADVNFSKYSKTVQSVTLANNDVGEFIYSQFRESTLNSSTLGLAIYKNGQAVKSGATGTIIIEGYFLEDSPAQKLAEVNLSSPDQVTFSGVFNRITVKLTSLTNADSIKVVIVQQNIANSSPGNGEDVK